MNINNYYTVAETAEKLQISKQAVYKRLSTDLKQGLMLIEGKKYIKADIIDSLVNSKVDTTELKVKQPNEQPLIENELIKALKSHIESLEKQNERLNNQIERLQYALMTEQERVKELTLPPVRATEMKNKPVQEPIKAEAELVNDKTETHTQQSQPKPLNRPVQKKTTAAETQKPKTANQTSTAELLKMRKPQPKKRKKFLDWLFN
jgi:predicted DNA-binding protein YlxM (UPF0122 family)